MGMSKDNEGVPIEHRNSDRFALTDEERAEILKEMEEAARTFPAYQARMEAACRLSPDTMRRRFNV